MNLKDAIAQGKLRQFVAEHKGEVGDSDALEATIRSMAGTSKEALKASSPDDCGD
jgi:hypothetical protein